MIRSMMRALFEPMIRCDEISFVDAEFDDGKDSNPTRVVSPVQQGLALSRPTGKIPLHAVISDLRDMTAKGLPASDLTIIVDGAPPSIIATVPLEPSSGIIGMDPSLAPPDR